MAPELRQTVDTSVLQNYTGPCWACQLELWNKSHAADPVFHSTILSWPVYLPSFTWFLASGFLAAQTLEVNPARISVRCGSSERRMRLLVIEGGLHSRRFLRRPRCRHQRGRCSTSRP